MEIELLNRAMRAEARGFGLCDEWYGAWADDTGVDELLNKYVRGIDFCIGHSFPDNKVLLKYAGREKLHEHGIYIDEEIIGAASGTVIINGHCTGMLNCDGFSVVNIYLRGDSEITVNVSDFAKVFIELWDDARLTIENNGYSRCFVYRHGGSADAKGDVLIREKK